MDSFRIAMGLYIVVLLLVIVLSVASLLGVELPPLPDLPDNVPAVQYRLSVYRAFTLEEYRVDGTLRPIALRIDLDAYPDYSKACDSITPDDNGHTCYSEDEALIAVFLDAHHIGR